MAEFERLIFKIPGILKKGAAGKAALQTVKKPCHSEEVAHTGVGIPRILQHFHPKIEGFYLYLGDCHTSDLH
jgi:hypothetical protein